MGGSSKQVIGYQYFTNLLLFIGNPIEKMLGINFDKRGWLSPFVDENGNALAQGVINSPSLFGENEGGVTGVVHVQYGTENQEVLPFYKDYMESKELQASAYPYQSYLAFTGLGSVNTGNGFIDGAFSALAGYMNDAFYVGNSGYMKEMLLWPKRIHVRNDGREQWYDAKAEIGDNMPYSSVANNFIRDGITFQVSSKRDIPAGIELQAYTDCIGGVVGTYDPVVYTRQAAAGSGSLITDDLKIKYGVYDLLKDLDIRGSGYTGSSDGGITLEHAHAWYPNWDAVKTRTMKNSVIVNSVGFGTIYLITLKSRTKHRDFKIFFGSESSYVITNRLEDLNDGYVVGRNLAIFLDAGDTAFIEFSTENDLDSGTYLLIKSAIQCIVTDYELSPSPARQLFTGPDINPIHKIREILTDDTAMNKPESSVNEENFIKAADRAYAERLGISWSITEKSCIDAINELCYHIEAGIRVNRQTGLYEMVLFRDDWFEEDEIHTISESKIKKGSMQYEITNADEVVNKLNVNYYDRENIKNSSFSLSESGLIQTLGRENAETVDFPYFMNMRNAEIVANWKLKILSTGVLKGSFTTGWREARKWNRYDLIRLPWSRRWAEPIFVRIMNIKLGGPTSNEVSIEWVEVVPSTGMMNTTIVADDPVDTQPEAPKPCNAKVFELPYFEAVQALGEREVGIELADNPEVGYLCAIAEKPQNNSLNAALYADSGNGFERVAAVNYCETAYLDQAIDRISSSFVVKNVGNIASVRVGSQIFINDEIMVYQSYDTETKVLTVKRGAFGIPQIHAANSILYFADDFIAVDQTLYVKGEIIDAKVLTTTPSGILALGDAVNHEVEFNAWAIRPYPPANVKINGEYWPTEIETDLIITWVDRNRAQQTGGEIIGWYEGGVTIEPGVTYQLILIERDENTVELRTQNLSLGTMNTYTFATSAMNANTRTIEITLKSLRDGYECYQSFTHTVELSQFFSAPYDLTVEFKND